MSGFLQSHPSDPVRLDPQRRSYSLLSIANLLRYGSVAIALLSVVFTSGVLIQLSGQVQLRENQKLQEERSRTVASSIETYLNELQKELQYLKRVRGLATLPQPIQRNFLEGLTRHDDAYESVAIFNLEGEALVGVSPFAQSPTRLADYPDFLPMVSAGKNYVSPVSISPQTDSPVITIAVPIRDANDQTNGALVAKVNLQFLNFTVSQANVGTTGYTYVVDDQQRIIAKQRSETEAYDAFALEDLSGRPLLDHLKGDPAEHRAIPRSLR